MHMIRVNYYQRVIKKYVNKWMWTSLSLNFQLKLKINDIIIRPKSNTALRLVCTYDFDIEYWAPLISNYMYFIDFM